MADTTRRWDLPPLSDLPDSTLLTVTEVAEYLGLEASTVEQWRYKREGYGPTYHRLGKGKRCPIRYYATDVRAWIALGRVNCADLPAAA